MAATIEAAFRRRLQAYATHLIKTHAKDVEYLTIHEMSGEFFEEELSENALRHVDDLISKAEITVKFPECCPDCTTADKEAVGQ